ncbi:MAG: DNA gyrase inhibitor YacG [Idiomarina sp.]|nr:DNA gyrase inhibitor YacG [Idiomarina sp.]
MSKSTPMVVDCPTCGKKVEWSEKSAFRPFCSERCKMIDLGEWAAEEKRIPGDDLPPIANPEDEY